MHLSTDRLESARLNYESCKLEKRQSPLRADLQEVKQEHLEMNVKKQLASQKKLLEQRSKLTGPELYDLRCFAPKGLIGEVLGSGRISSKVVKENSLPSLN
jgi:hypothetical protein